MSQKPKHPCNYPGCPALTNERYCEKHRKQEQRRYDERRGTAHQRGYTVRWRRVRESYLRRHPLCVECEKKDRITAATVVDHIIPHKGDHELFWNEDNWQSLCKTHHDIKTAKEDGGFGNG